MLWNWKTAILSSAIRAPLFFVVNWPLGAAAALRAALVELAFVASTNGFYGSITQRLARVIPPWRGTLAAVIVVPALAHTIEFAFHSVAGTPRATTSVAISWSLSVVSVTFNTFVMRRGLLTVGPGRSSLLADLSRLPRAALEFLAAPFKS